jgi:hypothetical protein
MRIPKVLSVLYCLKKMENLFEIKVISRVMDGMETLFFIIYNYPSRFSSAWPLV